MRFSIILAAALPALITATPAPRDNWSGDDLQVLNFALSLEHLEYAFYESRLDKYSQDDFYDAGFPKWARGRWLQIRDHEQVHVEFLTTAIKAAKATAVQPCKYKFPDRDPIDFASTSLDLETVGTSAYNGALQFLKNKDYLTASGSIISVEARHAAWINAAIFKENPWNTAFDIPLTPRQVYTIASNFIESCPAENSNLLPPGITNTFPQLVAIGDLVPGQKGQVKFPGTESSGDKSYWVIFKTGMCELRVRLEKDGWFVVPKEAEGKGATYLFITSDDKPVSDDNIVAGPALVTFDFGSWFN